MRIFVTKLITLGGLIFRKFRRLIILLPACFILMGLFYVICVYLTPPPPWTRETVERLLPSLNQLGSSKVDVYTSIIKLSTKPVSSLNERQFLEDLCMRLAKADESLQTSLHEAKPRTLQVKRMSRKVNVAVVACGSDGEFEAQVLIKSALMFSTDIHLHLIIFTDIETISSLIAIVMKLKWTVNYFGSDFTFEFQLDSFPQDDPTWREMWRPCSTQRLFFPSLLPHIDSLIYMDADSLFLTNVSSIWDVFSDMSEDQLAAMSSNSEAPAKGHYGTYSKVPFFGSSGLMAGIMLMNLTRMRQFNIEEKAVQAYETYHDEIKLADQDIYNIIFHFNSQKVHRMDCTYNFYNIHCGWKPYGYCYLHDDPAPICFCYAALDSGVKILHGQGKSFHNGKWPFITEAWRRFAQLDLVKDTGIEMIRDSKAWFATQDKPCFQLSPDALYSNAENYLTTVYG